MVPEGKLDRNFVMDRDILDESNVWRTGKYRKSLVPDADAWFE